MTSSQRSTVLALIVICSAQLSLVGCTPHEAPGDIDNAQPAWGPDEILQLSAVPTLVIGTDAGEMYEFIRVVGAARLTDGRIVVADAGSLSLRFFDSSGAFLTSVGERGEGPGEFTSLYQFAVMPGDTLVAGPAIGELSWFSGSGRFLARRGTTNPPIALGESGRLMPVAALDGSGTRVITALGRPESSSDEAMWVDSMPLVIVDDNNAGVGRIGMVPSLQMVMGSDGPRPPWFGATAVVTSGDGHLYVGFGAEYAIRKFDARGALLQTIRRPWTPTLVTPGDIDRYVTEWGARWITSTGDEADAEHAALRADPYAAVVPAFGQFIVDDVGRLWVREAHLGDAPGNGGFNGTPLVPSLWSVFDPKGRWLGDVGMPARFQPYDIGADFVLGKALDEDDVATIVMFDLGPDQRSR